jgi:hypothetical protein
VQSENVVAHTTKPIASGPALSWTQRHRPLYLVAWSGSDAPAMNPATQAIACSASTSELRNSTEPTAPSEVGRFSPAIARPEGSGVESAATTHTAKSRATATANAPASHDHSTVPGWAFQRASAARVSCRPWTRTKSCASTG